MSGGLLGSGRDRADRNPRGRERTLPEGRPLRLTLGAWEPFMVLVASIMAVAYFATKPCSSAMPKPRTTLTGHEGSVGSVDFRADGAMLTSVGTNGSIVLWDVASLGGDSFPPVGPGQNRCVALSPDGKLLATGSATGPVALHNLEGGETWPLLDSSITSAGAKCLAFH